MKNYIVNKRNIDQKEYLTVSGDWDPRVRMAHNFPIEVARAVVTRINNQLVEIHTY